MRRPPVVMVLWVLIFALVFMVRDLAPQTASGAPLAAVPSCTDHNPNVWHGVVKRDANGAIRCSHGHEHKGNPHEGDSTFALYNGGTPFPFSQEISHPWETTQENLNKHTFYAWHTHLNIGGATCQTIGDKPYGFKHLRVQMHADGHDGALTRFHSYDLEAVACDPADPSYAGYLRTGGHLDYGGLRVEATDSQGRRVTTLVPLASDSDSICGQAPTTNIVKRRTHPQYNPSPNTQIHDWLWYGSTNECWDPAAPSMKAFDVNTIGHGSFDDEGPVNHTAPNNPLLLFEGLGILCPSTPPNRCDDSRARPVSNVGINFSGNGLNTQFIDLLDGVADNKVTWTGYVNRFGQIVTGCSASPLNCIPAKLTNMKLGSHESRPNQAEAQQWPYQDFDVVDPATGQSLILHPN